MVILSSTVLPQQGQVKLTRLFSALYSASAHIALKKALLGFQPGGGSTSLVVIRTF